MSGTITKVSGPLVVAEGLADANVSDVVRVGSQHLIGEILNMTGDKASIQVYEETSGLGPGAEVITTGMPLSVELGPGMLDNIYDGIQRPLPEMRKLSGDCIARGIDVPALNREKKWEFVPVAKPGDKVRAGDVLGTVQETSAILHKIMVPNGIAGEVVSIESGEFTVEQTVAVVKDAKGAAHKLNNLLMTPFNGLGSAMTSFAAQNLGAGDYARIRKGTLQALIIAAVITAVMVGTGLLLTINGAYLHIFLSADKVTPETIRYGNAYLHIDLAMYPFLAFIFVMRNCVQGIGRPQFILGAGTAELVARVTVCLLLPPAIAGGAVSAAAPMLAFYAMCAADPVAWMSADAVLSVPFIRNILRSDYRYFYRLDK